MITDKF